MKKLSSRFLASSLITFLSLGALGCGSEQIQIGVVVPLTGQYQTYGEANRRGVELAFEEITSNGYPLELALDVKDTGSDPATAKALLDEQYANGAFVALGGSVSAEAHEMISAADKYDRVLLSPSATHPGLSGASYNFYRIAPSDLTEGSKMADFAFRTLNLDTVVILAEADPFAVGIRDAFQSAYAKQGGQVVEVIEIPPNTSDLAGLVGRAVTLNPKAVYLAAYAEGVAEMIRELRAVDYAGRILTTHAFSTPAAIASAGEAAAGVVLTQSVFEPDSEHAHVQKFVNAYREKYNEEPTLFAAEGYDAMKVLSVALKAQNTIPGNFGRGLRDEIKEYPGVTGSIQFDEQGDVRKFPRVYIIGENLALYDYSKRIAEQQKLFKERQAEIQRKLDELRNSAANMANGG